MARFIGYLQGNRGEASRLGSADSGIRAQAQGWDVGVKVYGHSGATGEDLFEIFATAGSHGRTADVLIGRVALHDGTPVFYPVNESVFRGRGVGERIDTHDTAPDGRRYGFQHLTEAEIRSDLDTIRGA